jgi:hypothetical protein
MMDNDDDTDAISAMALAYCSGSRCISRWMMTLRTSITPQQHLVTNWVVRGTASRKAAKQRLWEVPTGTLAVTRGGMPTRHVSRWTTTTRTLTTLRRTHIAQHLALPTFEETREASHDGQMRSMRTKQEFSLDGIRDGRQATDRGGSLKNTGGCKGMHAHVGASHD